MEAPKVTSETTHVVIGLHGIRTHARWQKAFAEVAQRNSLVPRINRWDFGYFSIFHFLTPLAREKKLRWFRGTYEAEIKDRDVPLKKGEPPSIIAHSFGTYLVAYALKRFKHLQFDRVLLCGSILPPDFDWQFLINRGQIRRLRVEYGVRDPWVRLAGWIVSGAGPSGAYGFAINSSEVEQEEFEYNHSEYFSQGHMETEWIPFFQGKTSPGQSPKPRSGPRRPWLTYALTSMLLVSLYGLVEMGLRWSNQSTDISLPRQAVNLNDDFTRVNHGLHFLFDRDVNKLQHGPDGLTVSSLTRGIVPILYSSQKMVSDFRAVLKFDVLTSLQMGTAGLIFRSDSDTGDESLSSYHLVGLNLSSKLLYVQTFQAQGNCEPISTCWPVNHINPVTVNILELTGTNTIRIDVVKSNALVYVNGHRIGKYDLGPGLDSGLIGIYLSNEEEGEFTVLFRGLTVSEER